MMEGREPRGQFEAIVDGLAEDFQPVGTYEQLLVQEIAACFWRKRRLLRFESRAAFESRDRRTFERMQPGSINALQPRYLLDGENFDAEDILAKAGLGLDIPNERDSMRVVRYEGTISRTLKTALAQLKTRQALRLANRDADSSSACTDRDLVVDTNAMTVNAGPEHKHLGAKTSLFSHALERIRHEEEEEAAEAEAAEALQTSQNNQTKPNSSTETRIQPPRARIVRQAPNHPRRRILILGVASRPPRSSASRQIDTVNLRGCDRRRRGLPGTSPA